MPQEFDLIQQYFTRTSSRGDVLLGIGDDGAMTTVPDGMTLVTTVDTFISGVHFPENTSPEHIGYKALAVNLSDLAAMGAEPAWFTLALTLPEGDEKWLDGFSRGLFNLANQHNVVLIGGDTTQGALSITISAHGFVPQGQGLTRTGAQVGDVIAVTGSVGEATLALSEVLAGRNSVFSSRLNMPTPRVNEGLKLRGIATSCLDISDGLLQDLSHICKASGVGAIVETDKLPASSEAKSHPEYFTAALSGGDDYELLFTCSPDKVGQITDVATVIGQITDTQTIEVRDAQGDMIDLTIQGYSHF